MWPTAMRRLNNGWVDERTEYPAASAAFPALSELSETDNRSGKSFAARVKRVKPTFAHDYGGCEGQQGGQSKASRSSAWNRARASLGEPRRSRLSI